jgi:hypothetical protein
MLIMITVRFVRLSLLFQIAIIVEVCNRDYLQDLISGTLTIGCKLRITKHEVNGNPWHDVRVEVIDAFKHCVHGISPLDERW